MTHKTVIFKAMFNLLKQNLSKRSFISDGLKLALSSITYRDRDSVINSLDFQSTKIESLQSKAGKLKLELKRGFSV